MEMSNGKQTLFEATTCSRCGGSGKYSYNMMDGSRCYGCSGTGVKLTKRGKAAAELYHESLTVPASEIAVGGRKLFFDGRPISRVLWLTIESVEDDKLNPGMIKISGRDERNGQGATLIVSPSDKMRVAWSNEEKLAKQQAALAYQESLTKTGKPRKVSA